MNLVLTIAIGENYERMSKLTHPILKQYADKIGAEFLVINEKNIAETTPHWEKFQIKELLDKYDRIIYFDTDIIIRPDCPSLFDIVPENQIGMFNEGSFTDRSKELIIDCCRQYDIQMDWDGKYYNTGVMVISKCHKDIFVKPVKEVFSYYEQTYINVAISLFKQMGMEVFDLDYKFNRMTCMDRYIGQHRFDSYIIHYAGYPNIEYVLKTIEEDIQRWQPPYVYKRNILIKCGGGLGDQVCAEPAIRFLKKNLYQNDNVTVLTHWTELFDHIQGIKLYSYDQFQYENDTPYYEVLTLPEPDSLQWSMVSHLLCHSVDYTSIALMKRILPLFDKTIHLAYSNLDMENVKKLVNCELKDLILVHAGRHWETKTFPVEFWNGVIKGLLDQGKKVCLIGKDTDIRGTVDVDPTGCIDLRNKINLKELFALISQANTLISNDSSPIHFAGAFDNNIVLIPSCKHPDHILPYRQGTIYYKTKAVCKKLLLDEVISHPTQVYETSADFKVSDWSKYLPEIEEVIKGN
jgi:hypothetical protein